MLVRYAKPSERTSSKNPLNATGKRRTGLLTGLASSKFYERILPDAITRPSYDMLFFPSRMLLELPIFPSNYAKN